MVTARNVEPDGPFVEALAGAVTAAAVELVVMTTHGRGPLGRFLLGGLSDEMIRHSPAPVLTARAADADPPPDLGDRPGLGRLLVPLDGSALAEGILDPAVRLAGTSRADLELVLVLDDPYDPGLDGPAARAAHDYLDSVTGTIGDPGKPGRTRVVERGRPRGRSSEWPAATRRPGSPWQPTAGRGSAGC
jgi:nucleotide-binding universal stress UspA family protein